MNTQPQALVASVSLRGDEVASRTLVFPQRLVIGEGGGLEVPVPAGSPYVASLSWADARRVKVVDGRGEEVLLEPGDRMRIGLLDLDVTLELVNRYRLRRSSGLHWVVSIAWFIIVFGSSFGLEQTRHVWNNRCEWFGAIEEGSSTWNQEVSAATKPWPWIQQSLRGWGTVYLANFCVSDRTEDQSSGINAEYLARLLREDYDGAEDGVVAMDEVSFDDDEVHAVYLPAGGKGPITDMGGAEDIAPEPIRTPETDEVQPEAKAPPKQRMTELDIGTPIEQSTEKEDGAQLEDEGFDEVADLEEDAEKPTPPPAEETEGWGISDWMDSSAQVREGVEIDLMLRLSRERLRINPDDPEALGVMAYYQYLATDYDDAIATFDRLIELYPGEAFAYNNKALVYKRQGLWRKEEGLYRIALALDPEDATAINNLAVNLSHQGRYDEALAYMEALETKTPDDAYADLHRAKIHADMGNNDLALQFLVRALEGMKRLDTLHHIEFRQDIRLDPSFAKLRRTEVFKSTLRKYYGDDTPVRD